MEAIIWLSAEDIRNFHAGITAYINVLWRNREARTYEALKAWGRGVGDNIREVGRAWLFR